MKSIRARVRAKKRERAQRARERKREDRVLSSFSLSHSFSLFGLTCVRLGECPGGERTRQCLSRPPSGTAGSSASVRVLFECHLANRRARSSFLHSRPCFFVRERTRHSLVTRVKRERVRVRDKQYKRIFGEVLARTYVRSRIRSLAADSRAWPCSRSTSTNFAFEILRCD